IVNDRLLSMPRGVKNEVILNYFLDKPSAKIHIKELARKLKISPRTSHIYLNEFADNRILAKEKIANALFFSLKNDSPLIKQMKKTRILSFLDKKAFVKNVLKENPQTTSIVLYGSYATGEYDEKSDVDILMISKDKTMPKKALNLLGGETTINVMSLNEWRLKSKTDFGKSVLNNYVVLYGNNLVKI
ncbi:MAG: nucleotidyltransferase domain-containing protein, partial [Candidatus Micrarchaeota archaeon]